MYEMILPIIGFAFVSSVTPGPNNIMMAASGTNFGFRPSLPHMLGVSLGFPLMVLLVGLGLAGLFATSNGLHQAIKLIGTVYMIYLAYKIATAAPVDIDAAASARPLRFWQAAAFQWVNPKAWIIAIGTVATYTSINGDNIAEVALIATIFLIVGFPCCAIWTGLGMIVRRWLSSQRHIRIFNLVMAALLLASIIPMALD